MNEEDLYSILHAEEIENSTPTKATIRNWYLDMTASDKLPRIHGVNSETGEFITTGRLKKRLTKLLIMTYGGTCYKLMDPCDTTRMAAEEWSPAFIKLFSVGFPPDWRTFVEDETVRVRVRREGFGTKLPTPDRTAVVKRSVRPKKSIAKSPPAPRKTANVVEETVRDQVRREGAEKNSSIPDKKAVVKRSLRPKKSIAKSPPETANIEEETVRGKVRREGAEKKSSGPDKKAVKRSVRPKKSIANSPPKPRNTASIVEETVRVEVRPEGDEKKSPIPEMNAVVKRSLRQKKSIASSPQEPSKTANIVEETARVEVRGERVEKKSSGSKIKAVVRRSLRPKKSIANGPPESVNTADTIPPPAEKRETRSMKPSVEKVVSGKSVETEKSIVNPPPEPKKPVTTPAKKRAVKRSVKSAAVRKSVQPLQGVGKKSVSQKKKVAAKRSLQPVKGVGKKSATPKKKVAAKRSVQPKKSIVSSPPEPTTVVPLVKERAAKRTVKKVTAGKPVQPNQGVGKQSVSPKTKVVAKKSLLPKKSIVNSPLEPRKTVIPPAQKRAAKRTVKWYQNAVEQVVRVPSARKMAASVLFSPGDGHTDLPTPHWADASMDDDFTPVTFTDSTRTFRMSAGPKSALKSGKKQYIPSNAAQAADRLHLRSILDQEKELTKKRKKTVAADGNSLQAGSSVWGRERGKRLSRGALNLPALPSDDSD
ncbi:titin-like [Paramacrobiotus metropolitanus]|uniref:titin-like n=1 Tax=Paramacrobiotus metropolitanus TaxID=2943436 RepID=UPI002445849B|nr:titin-like [Paramacrobiotus metropolitanus]